MKVEANGEGWRGEADLSSALRHTVNDVGDNDVSVSSLKRAGILPQMWDSSVSTWLHYSALQYNIQIASFWGPLSSCPLGAQGSMRMSY